MGKLRPRNVAAQGVQDRARIQTQAFWLWGVYAKPLVCGGGKAGKWKKWDAGPQDQGMCDFVRGRVCLCHFCFCYMKAWCAAHPHHYLAYSQAALQGKVIVPNSQMKKLRFIKLNGLSASK